jgi:Flp pilus assembly protein TadG
MTTQNRLHTLSGFTPRSSERGFVLVIVAILALVAVGFVGLAVDFSHEQSVAGQLQDAADASALAAAARLYQEVGTPAALSGYPATRQKAIDVAAVNKAADGPVKLKANVQNASNGDIVLGIWSASTKTFTPNVVAPNAVKVLACRTEGSISGPLQMSFGGPFDAVTANVSRSSIACFKANSNPLIHVLEPHDNDAMHMNGTTGLDVAAGGVQVNSDDSCALHINGTPMLTAGAVNVVGNVCVPAGSIMGPLHTGASVIPDPLANILPDNAAWNAVKNGMAKPLGGNGKISASGTFSPGFYPKGLDIQSSQVVTLQPGTYMFGGNISLNGQAQLHGTGVTILVDQGSSVTAKGGAVVDLSPPASGAYEGLVMMCNRNTTDAKACEIGGNGVLVFDGTIYVPSGGVLLGGTGVAPKIGQLVIRWLDVSGTADVTGNDIVPAATGGVVSLVQ